MAKKKSKKQSADSDSNVVRIKAGAPTPKKREEAKEAVVTKTVAKKAEKPKTKAVKAPVVKKPKVKTGGGPLRAFGGYFKGAWFELRQVRWPNRRATWSMTLAVLLYSAFFVVIILLLDAAFKYLFDLILGK